MDVQIHDGRGQNHQAYLWQYSRPGGGVVFDFRWGVGERAEAISGKVRGNIADRRLRRLRKRGGPKMVHAGCWAHSPGESSSRRSRLTPSRDRSHAHSRNGSTIIRNRSPWRVRKDMILPHAIISGSRSAASCSASSTRNWRQSSSTALPSVHWGKRRLTRSGCGGG